MMDKKQIKMKALAEKKKKLEDAGVPEGQMSNQMAGVDEYGTDAYSSGRAALEEQNNQLAREYAKKMAEEQMKKKAMKGK